VSAEYEAWRAKHLPRAIDPAWHGMFPFFALADLTPERLESFTHYAETMYLETSNPLYALRVWQAYRCHGRPPPEWVLHHLDGTAAGAWQLLGTPPRTPGSNQIAAAFGLGPGSRHYAALAEPRDALVGFIVMGLVLRGEPVEASIKSVATKFGISEREAYRSYHWHKSLPGISPDAS
jgi:hypothetical protein